MRCHEARTVLGPYLDSELDPKTSLDVSQHLESCADCARVFEAESKLEERMSSVLRQGHKTPALWDAVETKLAAPTWLDRLRSLKLPVRIGFAAGLATIVAALVVALWPAARVPDLAQVAGQDHQEFLQGKFGPDFTGGIPDSVASRMGARLDRAAFAELPSAQGFQAKGSRLCFLRGVPTAWTLGNYANSIVSILVMKQTELDQFPQMKQRLRYGEPVVCARVGGYQFAARLVGDHVVCAVADAPKHTLEDLLNSVKGG